MARRSRRLRAGGMPDEFENRLWPVNLAIFLLAGSVIGFIMAVGDFEDPRLLWQEDWMRLATSAWAQIAGVGLTLVLLLLAVASLGRAGVRRVQFCVLVSLLVHFWLGMLLHSQYLPMPGDWEEELARLSEEPEPVVLPEYHWEHIDQPEVVQNFETPIETQSPEAAGREEAGPQKVDRTAAAEKLAPVEPEDFHRHLPDPKQLRRADLPAPRREELAAGGQISRQELKQTLDPGEPIQAPEIKPGASLRTIQPGTRAALERRSMDSAGRSPTAAGTAPEGPASPAAAPSARRTARSGPGFETAARAPSRRAAPATDLADTEAEAPAPAAAEERPLERRLTARATPLGRWVEGPRIGREATEPSASGPSPVTRAIPRARRTEAAPQMESNLAAAPLRRPWSPESLPDLAPAPIEEPNLPMVRSGIDRSGPAETDRPAAVAASRAVTAPDRLSTAPNSGDDPSDRPGRAAPPAVGRPAGSGPSQEAAAMPARPGSLARSPGRIELPGTTLRADADPSPAGQGKRPAGSVDIASSGPGPLDVAAGVGQRGPNRQRGGLQVQIAAPAGPGGLSRDPSPSIGLPSRRARPEGEAVHDALERFVFNKAGGPPTMDAKIREEPRPAFQGRDPNRRGNRARAFGSTEETERAVEHGVEFLARHQFPAGHWALDRLPNPGRGYEDAGLGEMNADTAATGLALLAFLGAGYTHLDGKHQETVRRGVDWLLKNQQADGRLFTSRTDQTRFAQFYGHAMGTIALCEAFGMTGDPDLREPTQRAIRFIVATQHPELGGWRYSAQTESDTSVSGWKLMALKSAQMAGLDVPSGTLQGVSQWLDLAQSTGGSTYRYNPYAADTEAQRDGRRPNLAMTAEGLLMRMYLGWQRDNPALIAGAGHLKTHLPELGTADAPRRDSYYWYYATQVMFQMQGDYWTAWSNQLRPILEKDQERTGPLAGSWDPRNPVPDRWSKEGGRHYITALNLLMLEVAYRHLPLYQELSK